MANRRYGSSGSVRRLSAQVSDLQRRLKIERNLRYASDRQVRRGQRRRMATAEIGRARKRHKRSFIRGIARLGGGGLPRLALPGTMKRRRRRKFRCAKWVRR